MSTTAVMNGLEGEDPAVTRFREYLRIKTVHPHPDYGGFLFSHIIAHVTSDLIYFLLIRRDMTDFNFIVATNQSLI